MVIHAISRCIQRLTSYSNMPIHSEAHSYSYPYLHDHFAQNTRSNGNKLSRLSSTISTEQAVRYHALAFTKF